MSDIPLSCTWCAPTWRRSCAAAVAGREAGRTRNALVVVELALSLVLLVGAGLLIGSLARLVGTGVGFAVSDVNLYGPNVPRTSVIYVNHEQFQAVLFHDDGPDWHRRSTVRQRIAREVVDVRCEKHFVRFGDSGRPAPEGARYRNLALANSQEPRIWHSPSISFTRGSL